MGLLARFNVALAIVFAIGLIVSGYFSYTMENRQARDQILHEANLVLNSALAMREYTATEAAPLLAELSRHGFVTQTVPSYAAQRTLQILQRDYPSYSYREVALNPTNPEDLPADWEVGIIRTLRDMPEDASVAGEHDSDLGPVLYLAQPIRVTEAACLECHGSPSDAPQSMLAAYGATNGFGWKLDEIIGAQIVSVPMSKSYEQARASFYAIIITQIALFALAALVINVMARRLFTAPLALIVDHAERASLGKAGREDLPEFGTPELDKLKLSIRRLSISLSKAMTRLDQNDGGKG